MNFFISSASIVVLLAAFLLSAASECPNKCNCTDKIVTCKNASLTSIPSLPTDCEIADLSENKIAAIRDTDLQNLTKLKSLNLASNLIRKVDTKVFANTTSLTKLDLSNNQLTQVPDLSVESLESVDFSGNSITQNPYYVFGANWKACKRLSIISIARNKFEHFPSTTFSKLEGLPLTTLNMSGNSKLTTKNPIDPSVFRHISSKLKILDLSSNNLALNTLSGPLQFTGEALTTLFVRGNHLQTLDNQLFLKLAHLTELDLSGNQLEQWTSEAFSHFKLTDLDLSNNQIETIRHNASQDNSLAHIEKTLKTLKLSGNPFSCYCSLVWLRKWIDSPMLNVTDKTKMRCSQPQEMKGVPVLSLNEKNCSTEGGSTPKPHTSTTEVPTTTKVPTTTTTEPAGNTTTAPKTTSTPHNSTTEAPHNITTTDLVTTTLTPHNETTTLPGNMTTETPEPSTSPSPAGKKHGVPWWGVILILLLIGSVIGGGYLLFKRWRRRRLLDEGRLPIIGDQTA